VSDDLVGDDGVRLPDHGGSLRGRGVFERVRNVPEAIEGLLDVPVLVPKRLSLSLGHGPGRQPRPDPSARNALRMTATSIASCVSAPAMGVNQPKAAASIATPDIAIPAAMLWNAIP
jgi:hypothetical protein